MIPEEENSVSPHFFVQHQFRSANEWAVKIANANDTKQIAMGLELTGHYWFSLSTWMISIGKARLRKVAKQCVNYGTRVQNSVFECVMDAVKCRKVKQILEDIIDKEKDSLRFYYLGDKYKTKIEHIGAKNTRRPDEPLIF